MEYAWHEANSYRRTHPVGQKKANAWGLFDMHGNVWEWCRDWHGPYSGERVDDPAGPSSGQARVLRGKWYYDARDTHSAVRESYLPTIRFKYVGVRLVLRGSP